MSVVPRNGDVFAPQKLASRSVHGCTLLDRLFQKANGKWYFRTDRDSGDNNTLNLGLDFIYNL